MKRLFFFISLLVLSVSLFSQNDDTTKYSRYPNVYGIQYPRIWAPKVLRTPTDTIYSKWGIATIGTTFYIGNGTYWTDVSGGSGSVKYTDSTIKYVTPTQLLSTIQSQAANFAQNSYTYTATGGETTFSNSVLVNQVVMGVVRDGNSYLPTTSSPDSISAQYVAGTGTINFNVGIIAGVKVRVLYQPLAGSYNNYASIRYVDTYADMETQLAGTTPLIFYVKADEQNGGGTPAMYLYNNSILIRLIPQQAN